MKIRKNWTIKLLSGAGIALLLIVLLITSAQAVCYWIPNWWEKEYTKYDSPNKVVGGMSLDDAVYVTNEMLDYCIDNRDSIENIQAEVGGKKTNFFSDKEISHLADCKEIFLSVIKLRWIALLLAIALFIISYLLAKKKNIISKYKTILSRCYLFTTLGFIAILLIIGLNGLINFDKLFVSFHLLLFDNYNWLLDPSVDQLVNLMQVGIFSDFAITTIGIWLAIIGLISIPCFKNRK